MGSNKYMVATICMTYNQAPYIEETLHGFAIQDTTFPVAYIVIDDASTDGEQKIIKGWAQRFLTTCKNSNIWQIKPYGQIAIASLNGKPNSLFVMVLLSENHYRKKSKLGYVEEWWSNSKYHARCEGEDYWTHPQKLQKQVDFLESHPDYSVCVHNLQKYIEKDECFNEGYRYKESFSFDIKGYLKYWPTHPLTSVVRASVEPSLETRKKYKYFRDNHLFYYFLQKGQGYYMADVMGVYRVTNKGIWTSLSKKGQVKIDLLCYLELLNHFSDDNALRRHCVELYALYLFYSMSDKQDNEKIDTTPFTIKDKLLAYLMVGYRYVRVLFNKEEK